MATIVTRAGKGSPLTNTELDNNFTNLNTDKLENISSSIASAATITPPSANTQYTVTALAEAATIAAPSGTPAANHRQVLRLKDNGTARGLTWTLTANGFRPIGVTLPTTTVLGKTTYIGYVWNATDSFWDVIAVVTEA